MSDYIDRYAVLNVINDAIANNALSYESCVNEIMECIAKIPADDVAPVRHGQMTNADRIRSLSDEELAAVICKIEQMTAKQGHRGFHAWLDWLKEEVDTNDG